MRTPEAKLRLGPLTLALAMAGSVLWPQMARAQGSPEPAAAEVSTEGAAPVAASAEAAEAPAEASVEANASAEASTAATEVSAETPTKGDDKEQPKTLVSNFADRPIGADERPYYISGVLMFRTLAIADEDPANDRSLLWILQGGYRLFKGGTGFFRLGLRQNFVAEQGESGLLWQDLRFGLDYAHTVDLSGWGLSRTLSFFHRFQLYLPTSRESQRQDLYFAPDVMSQARIQIIDRLSLALTPRIQYRFHEFAERAGLEGGMNTRLVMLGAAALEYNLVQSERFGSLTLGIDSWTAWSMRYPSRESFDAETSSQTFWGQSYGWDLYAIYMPSRHLGVTASLQQGGNVLRDGIVNTFLAHRDETEIVVSVTGRY